MPVTGGLLRLETGPDRRLVDLTDAIASVVRTSGVDRGLAVAFVRDATSAITTYGARGAAADGGEDVLALVEHVGADADPAAWAALIGASETIPFGDRALLLGEGQRVVLVAFDPAPRERDVAVQIVG